MPQPAETYLEIRDAADQTTRKALGGARMVVGRSPDIEITLADPTVSRQHAELFVDPFGRWWIRDLGSRNGTIVNGKKIDDHLLQPGDRIQIERFTLTYHSTASVVRKPRTNAAAAATSLTVSDVGGPQVTRLDQMAPPKIDATHLSNLTRLSSGLLATENDDERLRLLCSLMVDRSFHGNTALAFRLDLTNPDSQPQMLCEPLSARNWRSNESPYISRTLLRGVRQNASPVVASNVASGGDVMALSLAGSVQQMAAIAAPIRIDAESMDVLYLTFPGEYGTPEWLALAALACEQYQQAEVAWEARRKAQEQAIIEKELQRASVIQERLIPKRVAIDGIDVAIGFEPCKWVGGDYVDVIRAANGLVYMTVCDVCGKGMQAAIITASLHTLFHTTTQSGLPLAALMERMNEYLEATLPDESFVTAICLTYDPATGRIESSNAGHPPAMIVGVDGKVRELPSGENPPLGYIPVPYETHEHQLEPGELLSLFTDGLTELGNEKDEMLGIPGVAQMHEKLYAAGKSDSAEQLAKKLIDLLNAFEGRAIRGDDRTFMLVRRV